MKKNLSHIFLCAVVAILLVCSLSACGSKADKPADNAVETKTTISLAEAKTVIVNALAINNAQFKPAAVEQGNRNLLEKFGKFTLLNTGVGEDLATGKIYPQSNMSGMLEYKNGDYTRFLLNLSFEGDSEEVSHYFDGTNRYHYDGESVELLGTNTSNDMGNGTSFFEEDLIKNSYLPTLEKCFSDEAFALYQDSVEKVIIENGYTLTLKMDILAYIKLMYGNDSEAVSEFEAMQSAMPENLKSLQNAAMVITFDDNDQINAAKVIINNVVPNGNYYVRSTANVEVIKYTGEIKEPQWVTDFRASQN